MLNLGRGPTPSPARGRSGAAPFGPNLGLSSRTDPIPSVWTERGSPIRAKSGFIITDRPHPQRGDGAGQPHLGQIWVYHHRPTPSPAWGQSGAAPFRQNPDLSSLPVPATDRAAPGAPVVGVLGRAGGSAQLVMGEGGAGFGSWMGAQAAAAQLIPGPREAASVPAHSVPASVGMATSFPCHPPRGTAALAPRH